MRRNVIARLMFAFSVAVASGCSLFVSLDGLGDGPNDGGSVDASLDAFSGDGALPNDGSVTTDAQPLEAGRASPCDGGHTICDDFDLSGEIPGDVSVWSGVDDEAKPGSNTITGDFFQSSPHAYAAFYGADAAAYNDEGIYRNLHGNFSSAHCEVDVRIEALSLASSQIQAMGMSGSCDDGEFIYTVWNLWSDGTQSIVINDAPNDGGAELSASSAPFAAFQLHRWYHVAYDFQLAASMRGSCAISIDGVPTATAVLPIANPGPHDYDVGLARSRPIRGTATIAFCSTTSCAT
ncbi:MAG: hypothetical protein ABI183_09625 [Polyangiaceae bacterium]